MNKKIYFGMLAFLIVFFSTWIFQTYQRIQLGSNFGFIRLSILDTRSQPIVGAKAIGSSLWGSEADFETEWHTGELVNSLTERRPLSHVTLVLPEGVTPHEAQVSYRFMGPRDTQHQTIKKLEMIDSPQGDESNYYILNIESPGSLLFPKYQSSINWQGDLWLLLSAFAETIRIFTIVGFGLTLCFSAFKWSKYRHQIEPFSHSKNVGLNAIAIFLLCITPVICLYQSHNYPLISAAFLFFTLISLLLTLLTTWFCKFKIVHYITFALGITALISFLTGFVTGYSLAVASLIVWWLREKVSVVVIASTLVIILSSFISIEKNHPGYVINKSEEPQMQGSKNRDPVFHIIFDEAAGISSLALAGKEGKGALKKLVDVLEKHGFTSIKNAHSSSMWSRSSLGHIINLEEVEKTRGKDPTYYFERNPLFDLLDKNGYKINVFQSSYLDFCFSAKSYIRSCYVYPLNSLSYFDDNGQNQLSIIVPETLEQFHVLHWFNRHLPKSNISENLGFHQNMPNHLGSLSQRSVQSDFEEKLKTDHTSRDQYYLVHFLYPHNPYYQMRDCEIKPRFDDWLSTGGFKKTSADNQGLRLQNDERRVRYKEYFNQYECFTTLLDRLLNKVLSAYPDATVILHGDHSSRISTRFIWDGSSMEFSHLDQQNYADLYPTLLAVKYPGNVPGVMDCRISLVEFAQHFFLGQAGAMGEKTRIIADRLFSDSDACVELLSPLSLLD